MIPETYQTLWTTIRRFAIDDVNAGTRFSDKLAHQNGWAPGFTARAIEEYRKFIFLCCISPTGASPSAIVDEVWHLHLTYTHNYWKEFCGKVLGKEIHHHPSKGGVAEKEKHQNWYAQTIAFYTEIFEEHPPADIWPPAANVEEIQTAPGTPQPLNYFTAHKKYGHVFLLPLLFPLLFGRLQPFALSGPPFLIFYGVLLVAAIAFLIAVRRAKQQMVRQAVDEAGLSEINLYAVSRFVFGKKRAIEAALVDLVSKEILIAESGRRFSFYPDKMDAETAAANPLAVNLLAHHNKQVVLQMKEMPDYYNENLTYSAPLSRLYQNVVKKDYRPFVLIALIMLLGLLRIQQGRGNGYPTTYLEFMMIAGGFILIAVGTSLSAKAMLQTIFIERHKSNSFEYATGEPMLAKFVFLGLVALTGSYAFANLEQTFRHHSSTGDGSGGCSSSGCGSSCGSSCGGGCGGCGGGD